MVVRLISFWEGLFSGAMLVYRSVVEQSFYRKIFRETNDLLQLFVDVPEKFGGN